VVNGEAVPRADLAPVPVTQLAERCEELCASGCRVAALAMIPGADTSSPDPGDLLVVLADDQRSRLGLVLGAREGARAYPALTARLPQAQAFERELFEQTGIHPDGHPWLKPLRAHAATEARRHPELAAAPHPFFTVSGHGVHEVAVGPVHAGIIEPGHFRFQCSGEEVLHLEIQLGYQHRGAESLMLGARPARRVVVAESIAGDTAIGHALAHARVCEALAGTGPPLAAQSVRGIALELERVANHVGDLGALGQDIGFLPGAAWFGRLRGEFLNLLMEISGNRYGRGLIVPGGVTYAITAAHRATILGRLEAAERDFRNITDYVFGDTSVAARFEHTGTLSHELAESLGVVGPVARASGCDRDVRRDHPAGIDRFTHIPVAVTESGDVLARALIRSLEAQRSMAFVREQLAELSDGVVRTEPSPAAPNAVTVALVEGWRGEIVHLAVTDGAGAFVAYKVVDPSFHNWLALAIAMRGNQISDFPLCNKSFNLSYAGHDL
jgi:Ni,Fe-hydrogenase III large subunit